jgi:hypothetical protein
MWKISTIRKILVDSDIKVSTRKESVEAVLRDAVARLDLAYTEADIKSLAREGMAWLEGRDAVGVKETLDLFAALLGFKKTPKNFGLEHVTGYGVAAPGPGKEVVFGPLVLYRSADNTLLWIDKPFSRTDRQQMKSLHSIAAGKSSVPVKGDAVFENCRQKYWSTLRGSARQWPAVKGVADMFKKCSLCSYPWKDRNAFIADPDIIQIIRN